MKHPTAVLLVLLSIFANEVFSQKVFPLYTGHTPNSKQTEDREVTEVQDGVKIIKGVSRPTISVYLPKSKKVLTGAVIICPGGGYWVNAIDHEGIDVAKKLTEFGIAAFVLKYRIPSDQTMMNREIGPIQDAQAAIVFVREHADEFRVDPKKVGIMGFSAGGHLAASASTHFQTSYIENPSHINLRPDFSILIYPVISFTDSIGHIGSRDQLIGKSPSSEKIIEWSNELQVTEQTPPAFLVHASDDDGVLPANSVAYYQALRRHHVDAEMHIYKGGGHGFGMHNKTTTDEWIQRLKNWLSNI